MLKSAFELLLQRERIHERCKTICPIKEDADAVSSIATNHGDAPLKDLFRQKLLLLQPC